MAPDQGGRSPRRVDTAADLRRLSERWRAAGLSVGLVPTMGALHAGHRSLIRRARSECDRVVVSIFVNPAQFGPSEDLGRYPRPLDADLAVCAEERADVVFTPTPAAVYPDGFALRIVVSGSLTEGLEGAWRPGHLDGVALVVAKLLVASRCDRAYFGQKDAQQCAMVGRLARDLDTGAVIVVCPTVRDPDGLAVSSRNVFLGDADRSEALAIPRGLVAAARLVLAGERGAEAVVAKVIEELRRSPSITVDYVAVVDPATFLPVDTLTDGSRIQVAARIASTRLIDTICPGLDELPVVPPRAEVRADGTAAPGAERSEACSASS